MTCTVPHAGLCTGPLTVHRRKAHVLKQVAVCVPAKTLVGVIGHSGAGKSTLLEACVGLIDATGDIVYDGTRRTRLCLRAQARRRAYLPQHCSLPGDHDVLGVLATAAAHQHPLFCPPAPDCSALLAQLPPRLTELVHSARIMRTLSGGERRLVALARTLAQGAGILILDEPTAGMDAATAHAVMHTLRSFARQGAAVVVSLHDLNHASLMCDQLLLMHRGRRRAVGTPAEVLTPDHVQAALGPMLQVVKHPQTGLPQVVGGAAAEAVSSVRKTTAPPALSPTAGARRSYPVQGADWH